MTQAEKIIKIIMPDLLRYLNMKKSGIIAQKRLDNILFPSMYCERDQGQELDYLIRQRLSLPQVCYSWLQLMR